MRPILNFRLSFVLTGDLKVNFYSRAVKKIKSSYLANWSVGQAHFPMGQNQKNSHLVFQLASVPPGSRVFKVLLQSLSRYIRIYQIAHLFLRSAWVPQTQNVKFWIRTGCTAIEMGGLG